MVRKSKGARRRTRKKLRKHWKEKGKIKIRRWLQEFNIGDLVVIKPDPSVHKGMPFRRFFGRMGKVVEKRGKAYVIEIRDGKKVKRVISLPVHLQKV